MIYCEVCELKRLKIKRYNREPPSVVLYEENPLDRIQVDIVALNSTIKEIDSKYHYVLCIVDHHSKKAWAKALKNKKPDQVAMVLDKFFSKMYTEKQKYPHIVHTDKSPEFKNEKLQEIC